MKKAAWCGILIVLAMRASAQVDGIPSGVIEQRIEAAAEQLGAEADLTGLFELLADRYQNPIDLNHTDAQELSTLLLLSDVQISSAIQHVKRNGKFLSIYELQTVNGFDAATIQLIRPFVTVRENALGTTASFKEIFKQGSNELTLRSTFNVEERKGFMDKTNPFGKEYEDPNGEPLPDFDDPQVLDSLRKNNKVYLGSPFRIYTRYRFRYRQNLSFGFVAEKDDGEQFFKGTQPRITGIGQANNPLI